MYLNSSVACHQEEYLRTSRMPTRLSSTPASVYHLFRTHPSFPETLHTANPLRHPSQNRNHRSHGPLTHTHAVPAELLGSAFPCYSHLCGSLGKFVHQIQESLRTWYRERTPKFQPALGCKDHSCFSMLRRVTNVRRRLPIKFMKQHHV